MPTNKITIQCCGNCKFYQNNTCINKYMQIDFKVMPTGTCGYFFEPKIKNSER